MAMDQEENEWRPEDGPKDYLGKQVAELLGCKSEMLNDYFSIQIEGNRNLAGIPLVLGKDNQSCCLERSLLNLFIAVGYIPDLTQLPSFVLRLASDVEWNVEKDCFDTVCRVMAKFYRKPNDHEVSFRIGYDSLKPSC